METVYVKNIGMLKESVNKGVGKVIIEDDDFDVKKLCDILENIHDNVEIITNKQTEIEDEFNKRNTYQGFNKSIINKVKQLCILNVKEDDYVVDMTCGNGFDTLFLSKIAKKVFGFDIQKDAINNTKKILESNNINNYELFLESHVNILSTLQTYKNKIKLVLFNLGYLPGGNKSIMTNPKSTLQAIKNSLEIISPNGLILIVFYPHPQGVLEYMLVNEYVSNNKINYQIYRNTLKTFAPFLMVIKP